MKGGLGNLMKQAQQMQANMQKLQAEIAKAEVTGESGGGMIKVIMFGNHQIKRIEIDDSVISDDKEMLEDLIAAACNDAAQKVEDMLKEKSSGMLGGMGLPPGMNLPF